MTSNFDALSRRLDKIEDAIEREWAEPLDASNLFDLDRFTDSERQDWSSFWQRVGSDFASHDGKGINLTAWPNEDLAILKNWALLYKSRTEAPA